MYIIYIIMFYLKPFTMTSMTTIPVDQRPFISLPSTPLYEIKLELKF